MKTKIALVSAGFIIAAGVSIFLLTSDNGKKARKKIKRKTEDFFDEMDLIMDKARKKYDEIEQHLNTCQQNTLH